MNPTFRRGLAATTLLGLALGCATNPATGKRELMLISEQQEIEMGREADAGIDAAYGLYPDDGIQAYVARLGATLAARSERPRLPWTFRVVDDPVVNAFALPGGHIYVTRGLLTYLDSEAELAGVLGHEIGHVTARHTANQLSKAQLATLGLAVGMVARPELQRFGGLAQAGLGLMFLKFGRDDEREADDLGLRYMTGAGYEPRQMISVFELLGRVGEESATARLPSWLSTHPAPEDRLARMEQRVAEVSASGHSVNRNAYLRRLDGMIFGENPREGFFRANAFFHPELRFRIEFPSGWKTTNERRAVGAVSPSQDALVVVTLTGAESVNAAALQFQRETGIRAEGFRRASWSGLDAVSAPFVASTEQGTMAGVAAFAALDGKVYRLLGYAPSTRWDAYAGTVDLCLSSFGPLRDKRYLDVEPRRIQIVEVPRTMTLDEFAARYPSPVPIKVLATINNTRDRLQAGELVKRVVGGRLPD